MTAAAETVLPPITNEYWVLRCQNTEQREELLAYAANKKVPCFSLNHFATDEELDLGWSVDLMAYDSIAYGDLRKVSIPEFKRMCRAYKA